MIRKDTWFMCEKIFRGFWRYRYLSWILSAVHQSHTSIFNGLTLHLSPESESDPLLFRKALILEVKTFPVLQEVTGKPVLRQSSPPPCGAAAVLAAWGRFLLPAQLDSLPRDPLSLWAPTPVSQPARWVLVQKEVGCEVRHWWARHKGMKCPGLAPCSTAGPSLVLANCSLSVSFSLCEEQWWCHWAVYGEPALLEL